MKKTRRLYPLNQSPLYKVNSIDKLAKILGCDRRTLDRVISKGSANFYFTHLDGPKKRELQVPKSQLKRIHTRLNNLLSRITPPEYLNSGVKGRSNVKNASFHLSDTALLKMDIKDFYTSTTDFIVKRCFSKVFSCTKEVSEVLANLCCVNGHIPTGSPISQSIAFYSNSGPFNHINAYSKSRGIRFSVYVDDLTFSGNKIPRNFISYVSSYLKKNRGYECHKFRTYRACTPKVVTGVVIDNGILKVKNIHRDKIRLLLNDYDRVVSEYSLDSDEAIKYFQTLIGHLFSAGQINGRYYQLGQNHVSRRKLLGIRAVNQNTLIKQS